MGSWMEGEARQREDKDAEAEKLWSIQEQTLWSDSSEENDLG